MLNYLTSMFEKNSDHDSDGPKEANMGVENEIIWTQVFLLFNKLNFSISSFEAICVSDHCNTFEAISVYFLCK